MARFVILALVGMIGYLLLRRAVASFVDDVDDRPRDRRDSTAMLVCGECGTEYAAAGPDAKCPQCDA